MVYKQDAAEVIRNTVDLENLMSEVHKGSIFVEQLLPLVRGRGRVVYTVVFTEENPKEKPEYSVH